MTWEDGAACRGRTDLFYSESPAKVAAAQWICKRCPVFDECAAAAVGERHGVWAGVDKAALPPDDRRHGTSSGYVSHKCRCDECKAWSRDRDGRSANNQDAERTRRRESLRKNNNNKGNPND